MDKRETQKIEAEIRILRDRKTSVEEDIKRLFNYKIKIIKDIASIESSRESHNAEVRKRQDEILILKSRAKDINDNIDRTRVEKEIIARTSDETTRIANEKLEEAKITMALAIKEKESASVLFKEASYKLKSATDTKKITEQYNTEISLCKLEQKKIIQKWQQRIDETDKITLENKKTLQETEVLKNKIILQKSENDVLSETLKTRLASCGSKDDKLQELLSNALVKEVEIDILKKKCENIEISLTRRINEIYKQENEIKLRKLRLDKLIKEHGVEREISELERELGK